MIQVKQYKYDYFIVARKNFQILQNNLLLIQKINNNYKPTILLVSNDITQSMLLLAFREYKATNVFNNKEIILNNTIQ
ncbi:28000_t:CDS:2 [Dentiscutata erythropus]|uniref:28000_t:CDS:1 n=1 Tax=Dentiscutata erythropus TaxID=1348616 RepID=A0A9N9EWS3_9GLOM|nr:28000_t:CDS:2 [Dentiscutata erythropus]